MSTEQKFRNGRAECYLLLVRVALFQVVFHGSHMRQSEFSIAVVTAERGAVDVRAPDVRVYGELVTSDRFLAQSTVYRFTCYRTETDLTFYVVELFTLKFVLHKTYITCAKKSSLTVII